LGNYSPTSDQTRLAPGDSENPPKQCPALTDHKDLSNPLLDIIWAKREEGEKEKERSCNMLQQRIFFWFTIFAHLEYF